MSLFTTLRRQNVPTEDTKEHDSDEEVQNSQTPLLSSPLFNEHNSQSVDDHQESSPLFSLRVKLNDGTQPNNSSDFRLEDINPGVTTVRELKRAILKKHSSNTATVGDATNQERSNIENRYLRLIVRGRMMAPDTSTLDSFSITKNDVIHAILAKEGTRGGQQARMLRRLNKTSAMGGGGDSNTGGSAISNGSAGGRTTSSSVGNRLLRRIGIDSNGIVISLNQNNNEDDDSDDSEDDDSDEEEDVEMGNNTSSRSRTRRRGQRERRQRERRGFDRLRSTGMTRDEVSAIRLYFARYVDRYIESRRAMILASRRMRGRDASSNNNTDESSNSLIQSGEETRHSAPSTSTVSSTAARSDTDNSNSNNNGDNGEEILTDRRRMEDEWMSTQGPYSEFRMNLNTSNPLLLAAISGGGASITDDAAAAMRLNAAMGLNPNGARGGGLFFRRAAAAVNAAAVALDVDGEGEEEEEEEDDLMFGGTLNPNGTYVPRSGIHPMYMGPVPSAGTERDFVWGFILGFFVGMIMLLWVWMPTVTHKQKVGIILGICFQMGMNLMLKNSGHAHI